jgi:hypothetical protein
VQERVLGVADVDEGGLEAGIEVLDTALVDAADHAVVGLALDLEFLEAAVDEEGDALFERLGIDDELAVGAFLFLEDREDLLEQRALFGAFLGAGFQFGGIDRPASVWGGGIDELFVILGGYVLGEPRYSVAIDRSCWGVVWVSHGAPGAAVAAQEIPAERSVARRGDLHVKSFLKRQTLWTSPCSKQQLSTKGATVADEGKRYARDGHEPDGHGDVHKHVHGEQHRDADGEQGAEAVPRETGDADAVEQN